MPSSYPLDGDKEYASYVPTVRRSVMEDLANHLQACCPADEDHAAPILDVLDAYGSDIDRPKRTGLHREGLNREGLDRELGEAERLASELPTPAQLDKALRTVERAASVMDSCQALVRQVREYQGMEQSLTLLKSRLSTYEQSVEEFAEELRHSKDEAEDYKQRSLAAEHKLQVLMSAVAHMFDTLSGRLPNLTTDGV